MYCYKCGNKIDEGFNFCAKCGTPVPGKVIMQPGTPQPAVTAQPAPAQPAKVVAVIDVKDIIRKPPVVVSLRETVDFKGAEAALETEGLKAKAFSGLFGGPQASEIRVDSLVKVYEPIHMVRAVYEGTFEVMKDFNLALDMDTVKLVLDGKTYDTKAVGTGGVFGGGAAPSIKLTGTETIKKRAEKGMYYDMNGVQKNNIEAYVKGKDSVPYDPKKEMARTQVLGTNFSAANLTDKVLTPDIIKRLQNAKTTIGERITVDIQTIYYPKYKALVTNLKNKQQKYLIFSAVDKQVFNTETF